MTHPVSRRVLQKPMRHHHIRPAQLVAPGNLLQHEASGVQHEFEIKARRSQAGGAGARLDLADVGESRMEETLAS